MSPAFFMISIVALFDVVVCLALTELAYVACLLLVRIQRNGCSIESCACHEVLFPCDLVRSMSLALSARTESYTRDAVTSLDGYAVC